MKNILVIYYTQSGQLKEIVDNFCQPFQNEDEIQVDYFQIKMKQEFPFPWPKEDFFNAFPESFAQIPSDIEKPSEELLSKKYDLIILAYQVWYLTPSIPINSFLSQNYIQNWFSNTPVITLSGSRNMWIMAQEKIKNKLKDLNATLVGNIAFVDKHINHISVITIVQWMFTGEKKKFLGIFPKPGVSDEDIKNAHVFGEIVLKYFKQDQFENLQTELLAHKAVEIRPFLIQMDQTANKMFKKWSSLILKNEKRRAFLLKLFNWYLLFAIWILSPIVNVIFVLLYPLRYKKISNQINYYKGVKLN